MSSAVGDSIEGEKISFWFGDYRSQRDGNRDVVKLTKNGEAKVIRPLLFTPGSAGKPTEYPSIRGFAATGEADKIDVDKKKVHFGAHRCFTGVLRGKATCKITQAASREQRNT